MQAENHTNPRLEQTGEFFTVKDFKKITVIKSGWDVPVKKYRINFSIFEIRTETDLFGQETDQEYRLGAVGMNDVTKEEARHRALDLVNELFGGGHRITSRDGISFILEENLTKP